MTSTLPGLHRPPTSIPAEPAPPSAATLTSPPQGRLRLRWRRPAAPAALLLGTALLYLIGLGTSGWANPYYSAAAQAAGQSWKALLFGSLDSANFITVDKTPAALWLMGLSVRLFGLNAWAILIPQALCGVGAVALLYATVRRWAGEAGGLIAGAVLATTPVAVLMFRFNNPDALLVLLLILSAYAVTRALERGSTWWLVLAGTAVGFGFLAKMLQALLVLPAFGLVYLLAGPPKLGRRVLQLLAATVAMIVAAGWWVALVELWPAASRPYIGAAPLELATGKAVMGMGGWSGDPAPTLAQFQEWVKEGKIAYFLAGGGAGRGPGGRGSAGAISTWVQENYTARTVGGQSVYDLR